VLGLVSNLRRCQGSQLFIVASQGLLPVIVSGIKCCDSQQGNSVSSTVKAQKATCMGDNSIIFSTECDQKLGGSLGTRLGPMATKVSYSDHL